MKGIARAITRLNMGIGRWASLAIFPIFLLLLADVVMRYAVGRPATWTSELATLIFGAYAVIAGGTLLARRGHANVDIFYGSFSRRTKAKVDILTWPLFAVFVCILLWQGYGIAAESIADGEHSGSVWNPPLWPTKLFIPIAAGLLLLQGIVRLWSDLRVARGLPADPDTFGLQAEDKPQDEIADAR